MIKLDTEKIQHISLFETMTHSYVKDCIMDKKKNRIIFVVTEGGAGKAIGKKGYNIKNLERILNKKVEVIEYSNDPIKFTSFLLRPSKVRDGRMSSRNGGRKVLIIKLLEKRDLDRGKITKARHFLKHYFQIDDLVIN
jgi:N utilization substance protein A